MTIRPDNMNNGKDGMGIMELILASKSPRRRELLAGVGVIPRIFVPDTDEDCDRSIYTPSELVAGLASRKARAAYEALSLSEGPSADTAVILAADTVVALDGAILEKPKDNSDARRMLMALSGRTHTVHSGIAVMQGHIIGIDAVCTEVFFRPLSAEEIDAYIATGEPMDKAGAYGIQSRGGLFVEGIRGDYFNVVGLPLAATDALMRRTIGLSLSAFAT